ncbi:MAG TPA: hypothetical protein VGG39_19170 [Polyangiaceae bacterium]
MTGGGRGPDPSTTPDGLEPLPIASFKLQLAERRARVVPGRDAAGRAFEGPGVDLLGDEADAAFALARPILAWLEAREPVRVRSLSFDVGRRRLLVTIEEIPRPRVVKIDPGIDAGACDDLLRLAGPLLEFLGRTAARKLALRSAGEHSSVPPTTEQCTPDATPTHTRRRA